MFTMEDRSEISPAVKEKNPLVERLGKNKVRAIAALGMAAGAFLGISGKAETGAGGAVEVPNPVTGENVMVGVAVSSGESKDVLGIPIYLGFPEQVRSRAAVKDFESYEVRIGQASFIVYKADVSQRTAGVKTVLGVYPAAETLLRK